MLGRVHGPSRPHKSTQSTAGLAWGRIQQAGRNGRGMSIIWRVEDIEDIKDTDNIEGGENRSSQKSAAQETRRTELRGGEQRSDTSSGRVVRLVPSWFSGSGLCGLWSVVCGL